MAKPIIYICGPITTGGGSIAENKAAFFKAAELLESKNCVVLHTAGLPLGLTERDYMRISNAMLESASVLYVLPFSGLSMGARSEIAYARKLGLKVIQSTYSPSKHRNSIYIGDMHPTHPAISEIDTHLVLLKEFGVVPHEFGSNSNKGHVYDNEIKPVMSGKNNYD